MNKHLILPLVAASFLVGCEPQKPAESAAAPAPAAPAPAAPAPAAPAPAAPAGSN